MSTLPPLDTAEIAYRAGQVDALASVLLSPSSPSSSRLRQTIAVRALARSWAQYCEDRDIGSGMSLIGAECGAERNAFLKLVSHALPEAGGSLDQAIALVRKIAIRPLAAEVRQSEAIFVDSMPVLETVVDATAAHHTPTQPVERLIGLFERLLYSTGNERDALSATARTPCWALNVVALARPGTLLPGVVALPCPGLVCRRMFRADCTSSERRAIAHETMLDALHGIAGDLARVPRALDAFARTFPSLRSTSRLLPSWLLLFGFDALTPAQLARSLPATKAGAGKLLRQLEQEGLARSQGPWTPFVCAKRFRVGLAQWRERPASGGS